MRPQARVARAVALLVSLAVVTGGCSARQPQSVALGVVAEEVSALDDFAAATGRTAEVYSWFQAWAGEPAFDAARATAAASRGALPLLTWEPWAPGAGPEQPAYSLARIVDGGFDGYIATVARQIRDWDGTVGMRFLHELNATHYPWGAGVNNNSPADAVAAWKHVREVFQREGANNVVWFWAPNVHAPGTAAYAPLYPGDDWVDWVGLDGYNGGTTLPWGGWRTPEDLFGASIDDLRELSDRPMAITEVGSAEQGGNKALWVDQLFRLVLERDIRLVVWFQLNKEADWRLTSSADSSAAFHRAAAFLSRVAPMTGAVTEIR